MVLLSGKKTKFLVIVVAVLFTAGFLAPKITNAATSTVRGAAWWGEENQYVFFDCLDDVLGDRLDETGNLTTPPGFHFYSPPCVNLEHHVYIDSDNNFSGKAWNSALGLISFDGTEMPPDGGASISANCPSTCNPSNNCWACYDPTDQNVYGWARVDDTGEWIRLDSATTTPVRLQGWDYLGNSVLPGHGIMPGDFVGDASSDLGWLSFNCASELSGAGNCATRDYKVYLGNLQLQRLSAPNWSYSEACSEGALRAVLKWDVRSGAQAGYEIVVNDNTSFATTTGDYVCWSGIKTPSVASQYIIPNTDTNCQTLSYGTNYYWWIRLYYLEDGIYKPTVWYQYGATDDHAGLLDEQTSGDPDSNIKTFTTYSHEFPNPFFTWSPYDILVGTSTEFTSGSEFYGSGSPTLPQSCYGTNCRYLWTTTDPAAIISDPGGATTSITFFRATGTSITLRVTDTENYVCSLTATMRINYGLPIWREVKAE